MGENVTFFGVSAAEETCVLDEIRYEDTHERGEAFTTRKLGVCEVVYRGVAMTPNAFEKTCLGRKAGKWVVSIRARRAGEDQSVTFQRWFEENVLLINPTKRRNVGVSMRAAVARAVEYVPEPFEPPEPLQGEAFGALLDEMNDADPFEFPNSPARKVAHPPAQESTPNGRKVGRVRVTVRNVPTTSLFFKYFDGGYENPSGGEQTFRDVLFDPATARAVGYRAVCPVVAAFTLFQFFHAHTSTRMLRGSNPPPVLYSDRFRFLFDDPLARGKVFAFDEHDEEGVSRTRCYLYDGELAEFVKFCGFSSAGDYVGIHRSNVSACADRLDSRAAAVNYQRQATLHEHAYREEWSSLVANVNAHEASPEPESPRPSAPAPGSTPEDPEALIARKTRWFANIDKFKLPGSRYAPRPENGIVTDRVWSLFCDACWSTTTKFSDTFTFPAVVASLKAELGKEMTFQERCEVADCMTWCAVQGGRLPA